MVCDEKTSSVSLSQAGLAPSGGEYAGWWWWWLTANGACSRAARARCYTAPCRTKITLLTDSQRRDVESHRHRRPPPIREEDATGTLWIANSKHGQRQRTVMLHLAPFSSPALGPSATVTRVVYSGANKAGPRWTKAAAAQQGSFSGGKFSGEYQAL